MKKRTLQSILLCLLPAALLCACGEAARSAPAELPEATPAVTLIERLRPEDDFGRAESLAMANFLCKNRALLADGYLYTLEYDEALRPVLGRYRAGDDTLGEFTVLAEDCVAEYLSEDAGDLYYIDRGRLERLGPDGERRVLAEDAQTLQLANGRVYFLDTEGRFCRMERDGGGRTVLHEGPLAYPYVMGGLLLAQKGADEALYLLRLEDGAERRLSEGAAYAPLRVGRTLYFTEEADGGKRLCALDLDDDALTVLDAGPLRGAAEFFYDDGWRARLALAGELLRQRLLPLGGGGTEDCAYSGYHLLDCVGPGLYVDAVYEADGRLHGFLLHTPDGGGIRYFGGEVIE